MKKLFLAYFCSVTLLALVCLPAEARIVIGIVKSSAPPAMDQLASALSQSAADDVQLRQFDNESALTNWLIRFRELDTAIVSAGYIDKQPAGTLSHLADLHLKSAPTPLSVVSLRTLPGNKAATIQKSLLGLTENPSGQKALAASSLVGFTLPGQQPKRLMVKPEPVPPKPQPPKPVAEKRPEPAPAPAPPKEKAPGVKPEEKAPVKKVVPFAKQEPAKEPAKPEPKPVVAKQPPKVTEEKGPAEQPPAKVAPEKPVEKLEKPSEPAVKPPSAKEPVATKPVQPEQPAEKKSPLSKRLILFIILVILVAILLKVALLVMRWQNRQRTIRKSSPPPSEVSIQQPEEPVASVKEPEEARPSEPLVVESGFLGPGKVPPLLKRCADLPEPVILQVTKGSCEKMIYFAAGQVAGAMTHNATLQDSGIRWNKLGSMLLREEFITREERDQAMALLTKEPNLRFGEALLKLGYITLAELRHALTRQAKITIYSLILFPEGKYKVYAEDGTLPAEESVALEVTSLIREASHHQSEWMAIREALPNLNTALSFTPAGKDKLEQVNLSAQQQEIMAQVDGKRSINELSAGSSMMDYEVYRFLYMMVKAGVLQ